jgi:hypothetical protein
MTASPPKSASPTPTPDGLAISVIGVSPPRGRLGRPLVLAPQTDPHFELIDAGQVMSDLGLVNNYDASPGLSADYAAALASGDVLALIAADAEPAADWIASIRRFFAEQPHALAVTGGFSAADCATDAAARALEAGGDARRGPVLHIALRASAFRAIDGCDYMRPPEADVLSELATRLEKAGTPVAHDERIIARAAPAGGLGRFLRREGRLGCVGSRYGPGFLVRLGQALTAPRRAARLAPRGAGLAAAVLAVAGGVARAAGRIWGLIRGGQYDSFASPLLGPVSPMLVAPGDTRAPAASVIVPIKGTHRCGLLALHALLRQDAAEPYEVIACLAEDDLLTPVIAGQLPQIRFATCGPNAGPGGGRNAGIAVARGQVLTFTDADCLADRTWLRLITAAVRARQGGLVRGWRQVHHMWSAMERAMQLSEEGTAKPAQRRPVPGTCGATMAVSRQILEITGARFAEYIYGAEEIALLTDLPPEKRTVWLDPDVEVRELRVETFAGARRRLWHLGHGSGWLRQTHTTMRGAAMARHPWLSPALIPVRLLLTASRLRGCGGRAMLDFCRLSPLMACLLIWYAAGFAAGARGARAAARANATNKSVT